MQQSCLAAKSTEPSRDLLLDNLSLYFLHFFELFLSYFSIIYTPQANAKVIAWTLVKNKTCLMIEGYTGAIEIYTVF